MREDSRPARHACKLVLFIRKVNLVSNAGKKREEIHGDGEHALPVPITPKQDLNFNLFGFRAPGIIISFLCYHYFIIISVVRFSVRKRGFQSAQLLKEYQRGVKCCDTSSPRWLWLQVRRTTIANKVDLKLASWSFALVMFSIILAEYKESNIW